MKLPPFYPIIDADRIAAVPAAEAILDAGARMLQYRRKSFFSREALEEASRIAELCRSAGALFIVNDRADIAMLLKAGLHLGQDDICAIRRSKASARYEHHRILNPQRATIARGRYASRWITWRSARSSPLDPREIPIRWLDWIDCEPCGALTKKPLVAIGGITRDIAPQVFEAGADSVAIIGDLISNPRARAEEWIAISARARVRDAGK